MPTKLENERKLKLFVAEYLINGGNATKAAIKAGSKPSCARQEGCRFLKKPTVRRLMQQQVEKAIISADEVLTELKTIGMGKYSTYKGDKVKSLELLGKHLKIFTEKSEISIDLTQLTDDQLDALANGKG